MEEINVLKINDDDDDDDDEGAPEVTSRLNGVLHCAARLVLR